MAAKRSAVDPKLKAWAKQRLGPEPDTNPVDKSVREADKALSHWSAKSRNLDMAQGMHRDAMARGGDTQATGQYLAYARQSEKGAREALDARREAHEHTKKAAEHERGIAKQSAAETIARKDGRNDTADRHAERRADHEKGLAEAKGKATEANARAEAAHKASNDEYLRDEEGKFRAP